MHIHPTVTELIPTMLGESKPLECRSQKICDRTRANLVRKRIFNLPSSF